MTHIDRPPREVLLKIFSYLNKHNLKNCIQVSQIWKDSATQAIYEDVTLQAFQIHKIKALLEGNLPNQDDYFSKLQWTKILKIQHDTETKLERQEFSTLLSYLPNLQEIYLKDSDNNDLCMDFLRDIDSTTHLKHIKRIHSKSPGYGQIHLHALQLSTTFAQHLSMLYYGALERLKSILVGLPKRRSIARHYQSKFGGIGDSTSKFVQKLYRFDYKILTNSFEIIVISLDNIDMYDWIEQVIWDYALKLGHHMQSIPNATIDFDADKYYEPSSPRPESRMTKFFKLLGAVKGDRQNVFCTLQASDFQSKYATIGVIDDKKVDLFYDLSNEEYGEYPIENEDEEEEETKEEYIKRISDSFVTPLPAMEKSLIGTEVINSWTFFTCRNYPSIHYRVLKYVLINCPHLQFLDLSCVNKRYKTRLASSQEIRDEWLTDKRYPSRTSQDCLKYVRFEGVPPTQGYLDLVSSYLPNIETIVFAYQYVNAKYNDARKPTIFIFNLTAFHELKHFRVDIASVVDFRRRTKDCDYLLLHIKYSDGDEAFYSIQKEVDVYQLQLTTEQFILKCSQKEDLFTKLLTFECNNKLENFSLSCSGAYVGKLRFGELQSAPPSNMGSFYRRFQ